MTLPGYFGHLTARMFSNTSWHGPQKGLGRGLLGKQIKNLILILVTLLCRVCLSGRGLPKYPGSMPDWNKTR